MLIILLQVSGGAEVPLIEQRASTGWAHVNQTTSERECVCAATAAATVTVTATVTVEQQQWQLAAGAVAAVMTMMTAGVAATATVVAAEAAAATATTATRYKGSMGGRKKHRCAYEHQGQYERVRVGGRGAQGYERAWRGTNKHKTSMGGTNKCVNAVWAVAEATCLLSPIPHPSSPIPLSPLTIF